MLPVNLVVLKVLPVLKKISTLLGLLNICNKKQIAKTDFSVCGDGIILLKELELFYKQKDY